MGAPARSAALVAGLGMACVAYGTFVERHWFRIHRETIRGVLRDPSAGPVRVLLISDLHLSPPEPRLERFVRSLADEDYDLVVAAGDLLGAVGAEERTVELLTDLTVDGTPGVAVLGSNDLFGPSPKSPHRYFTAPEARVFGHRLDTQRLRKGLADEGWEVLEDRRAVIETALGAVEVGGLRDPHLRWHRLPDGDDLRVRENGTILRLGLVHAPYRHALDFLTTAGYDLLLCGHTHGGQVRLPPLGALVNNCDLPLSMSRGTSPWNDATLHVTAGVGQSQYAPFRFACRPEAALLELTA